VAATVVSLLQYVRVRDRRMLLLAALFACQAQALAREWWDVWRDVYQAGVCAAGLSLLLALAPPSRHPASDARRPATPPPDPELPPDGARDLAPR
jgi:hypothetical protein